jgi:hypothetical protein
MIFEFLWRVIKIILFMLSSFLFFYGLAGMLNVNQFNAACAFGGLSGLIVSLSMTLDSKPKQNKE